MCIQFPSFPQPVNGGVLRAGTPKISVVDKCVLYYLNLIAIPKHSVKVTWFLEAICKEWNILIFIIILKEIGYN